VPPHPVAAQSRGAPDDVMTLVGSVLAEGAVIRLFVPPVRGRHGGACRDQERPEARLEARQQC
jgi:hypothetical protein